MLIYFLLRHPKAALSLVIQVNNSSFHLIWKQESRNNLMFFFLSYFSGVYTQVNIRLKKGIFRQILSIKPGA